MVTCRQVLDEQPRHLEGGVAVDAERVVDRLDGARRDRQLVEVPARPVVALRRSLPLPRVDLGVPPHGRLEEPVELLESRRETALRRGSVVLLRHRFVVLRQPAELPRRDVHLEQVPSRDRALVHPRHRVQACLEWPTLSVPLLRQHSGTSLARHHRGDRRIDGRLRLHPEEGQGRRRLDRVEDRVVEVDCAEPVHPVEVEQLGQHVGALDLQRVERAACEHVDDVLQGTADHLPRMVDAGGAEGGLEEGVVHEQRALELPEGGDEDDGP